MATIKITKRAVDGLAAQAKAEGRVLYAWDADLSGFGLRAGKTGVSYFVEYRLGGRGTKNQRMTIGKHGVLTPDEARKLAKEELGKVARGSDVAQEKADARRKLAAGTFKDAVERYLATAGRGNRSWPETRRLLEYDAVPVLGSKPMVSVTRSDVAALIDTVAARSPSVARAVFGAIRPFFKWCRDRGLIEGNPIADLKGPEPLKSRDRVLSDVEIRAFWQAASEENWPFSSVFKVLLLTGQRREEVAGMRWREVDLDAGQWTIAKERCKNGKAHTVDLYPEAIRMLDRLGDTAAPRLVMKDGEEDFVFSVTGRSPVVGFSKAKRRLDARMKEILGGKFQPWRTHDLRRSAASGMAGLGFQPHVIERVLNHVSGVQAGLVSVYHRHEYRAERKAALMAWGAHVMEIVSGQAPASNVVRFAASR
jgi:integrase